MEYTKYETARLLGSRALQIKMGAPILIKVPKNITRPLDIARLELEKDVLPITVKRPLPRRIEAELKREKEEKKKQEAEEKLEEEEEEEIKESGD